MPERTAGSGPKSRTRKALVIYLMSEPETPELARAAVEGGADIIELGFPFSDPLADGPVIRRAGERALARGMRTRECIDVLARTHELVPDTPLVPMTYSSILEAYGWERFSADIRAAGAASMIVSDLPAGERAEVRRVRLVERTRSLVHVPLYAGFGISTPAHARTAAELVDGIAVGTRAVQVAEDGPGALHDYVASLREALETVAV